VNTASRYVLVCNEAPASFILCIEDGEATSVQLTDYLATPASFAGLVAPFDSLAVAQRALTFARRNAGEWRCSPHTIGIYTLPIAQ
jgi:hypothetical protein